MSNSSTVPQARRIHVWIWFVAAAGLLVGGVILALFARHVGELERMTDRFHRRQQAMSTIREQLKRPVRQFEASSDAMFDLELPFGKVTPISIAALDVVVTRVNVAGFPPSVATAILDMIGELRRAAREQARGDAWRREHDRLAIERTAAQRTTSSALDGFSTAVAKLLGHARRTEVERIEILDNVTKADLRRLAAVTADDSPVRSLERESRVLRQLVVVVEAGEHRKVLSDLGARRLPTVIARIERHLRSLRTDANSELARSTEAALASLERALLGKHRRDDDPPGLLASHLAQLAQRGNGAPLESAARTRRHSLHGTFMDLEHTLHIESIQESVDLRDSLRDLWRTSLWTGVGAGLLFLALAASVSRNAHRQVRELLDARREANDAAHAQGAFLANMSHEIRTPMNGVMGMTEVLGETELDGEQRQLVGTIQSSAEALLTIINDILDFSKIEAGRLELDNTEFDLRHTIEDTIDLLDHLAHARGLTLLHRIDAEVPTTVQGDPVRLRQILLNLTANAIKFTPAGLVEVRIEHLGSEDDRHRLRFAVRDTGIGISDENLVRLFRPFHQADGGTTRRYGGTGLGLTICNRLVQLMQGDISVHSVVDQGSTFEFSLWLRSGPTATPPQLLELSGHAALVVDSDAAFAVSRTG